MPQNDLTTREIELMKVKRNVINLREKLYYLEEKYEILSKTSLTKISETLEKANGDIATIV